MLEDNPYEESLATAEAADTARGGQPASMEVEEPAASSAVPAAAPAGPSEKRGGVEKSVPLSAIGREIMQQLSGVMVR